MEDTSRKEKWLNVTESVQHQWVTQKDTLLIFQFWCLHAFWKPISQAVHSPMHLTVPVAPGSTAGFTIPWQTLCSTSSSFSMCCPVAVSSGGHLADFAFLHPNLLQWVLLASLSGLLSSVVQSSSLPSVKSWQTVFFILVLPYEPPPQPTLLTLSCMGDHPGVKSPGWKTGGF